MKRQSHLLALALVMATLFSACAAPAAAPLSTAPASPSAVPAQPAAGGAIKLTDQAGKQVTLAGPAQRVVSSYGMASLYVYAVGAGDRLAAATFLMTKDAAIKSKLALLQPDATKLPDPGGQTDANVEEIARARPDLLLISARAAGQDTFEALKVPIIRYEGETTARLKEAISLTGQALGPEAAARAAKLTGYMDRQLAVIKAVSEVVPAGQRKRVFMSGTSPLKTAGKDMLQSEMVSLAGGVNVAQELAGYWPEVNLEQLTKWDPEVIFTVPYKGASVEAILNAPEWANITAVKNKQVFMLPKYLGPWDTPIPEAILGIQWMAGKLYPDTLAGDCAARTSAFYQDFYGLAAPAADVAELCR